MKQDYANSEFINQINIDLLEFHRAGPELEGIEYNTQKSSEDYEPDDKPSDIIDSQGKLGYASRKREVYQAGIVAVSRPSRQRFTENNFFTFFLCILCLCLNL